MKHNKKKLSDDLLNWYNQHARVLPWRSDASAYHVWVSEIMLQQTRVEAVIPFYERFTKVLPDIKHLAEVDDDKLTKLWEGLGYYRRVHNMKKCAKVCVEEFHGELPKTYDELLSLPGIGPYSAGAVASIAYKECVPAIDGNVLRVFSRLLLSEDDIAKESTKKKFRDVVLEYIPKEHPNLFNQAVMEIGALVCIPNGMPKCDICPLSKHCGAFQTGQQEHFPNKTKKKARRIEEKTIVLLKKENKVLLKKRASEGLLANMYEFLTLDGSLNKKELLEYLSKYRPVEIEALAKSKHIFSHIEWHMTGFLVEVESFQKDDLIVDLDDIGQTYAIPTAFKAYRDVIVKRLKEH